MPSGAKKSNYGETYKNAMAAATAPSFTQKQAALFKNVAGIEIGELKDSLAYAEYLLAQNVKEKEELLKINAEHTF